MLREVEGLNVADTAGCLGIGLEAVKTRLHRARAFLRHELQQQSGVETAQIFPFHLTRCNRVVEMTLRKICAL